jgi:hypothetical protein
MSTKLVLNNGRTLFSKVIDNVAATIDFANVVTGSGATATDLTITGAELGDYVFVAALIDTQGLHLFGWVSAANTVKVRVVNNTGADVNLASAVYNVKVVRG